VPGVAGIDNAITWAQATDAHAAADAIAARSGRYAGLLADVLWVETSSGGLAILSGTVSSWGAAHDPAVAAAWSAPGHPGRRPEPGREQAVAHRQSRSGGVPLLFWIVRASWVRLLTPSLRKILRR